MQVLESSIEKDCYKEAKKHKCQLLKLQGTKGWPDRLLMVPRGKIVLIEFKRPGGRVAPMQTYVLDALSQMGFRAELVYSLDQFKMILTDLLHQSGTQSPTKTEAVSGLSPDPKLPSSSLPEWVKRASL